MEDAAAGDEPPPRASTSGKPASGLALVKGPGGLPLTEAELQRWGTLSMRGNDATTAAESVKRSPAQQGGSGGGASVVLPNIRTLRGNSSEAGIRTPTAQQDVQDAGVSGSGRAGSGVQGRGSTQNGGDGAADGSRPASPSLGSHGVGSAAAAAAAGVESGLASTASLVGHGRIKSVQDLILGSYSPRRSGNGGAGPLTLPSLTAAASGGSLTQQGAAGPQPALGTHPRSSPIAGAGGSPSGAAPGALVDLRNALAPRVSTSGLAGGGAAVAAIYDATPQSPRGAGAGDAAMHSPRSGGPARVISSKRANFGQALERLSIPGSQQQHPSLASLSSPLRQSFSGSGGPLQPLAAASPSGAISSSQFDGSGTAAPSQEREAQRATSDAVLAEILSPTTAAGALDRPSGGKTRASTSRLAMHLAGASALPFSGEGAYSPLLTPGGVPRGSSDGGIALGLSSSQGGGSEQPVAVNRRFSASGGLGGGLGGGKAGGSRLRELSSCGGTSLADLAVALGVLPSLAGDGKGKKGGLSKAAAHNHSRFSLGLGANDQQDASPHGNTSEDAPAGLQRFKKAGLAIMQELQRAADDSAFADDGESRGSGSGGAPSSRVAELLHPPSVRALVNLVSDQAIKARALGSATHGAAAAPSAARRRSSSGWGGAQRVSGAGDGAADSVLGGLPVPDLLPPPSSFHRVYHTGVSVKAILKLDALLPPGPITTETVAKQHILPITSRYMAKLSDLISQQSVNMPKWYIVHAWAGDFHRLAQSLKRHCADMGQDPASTYVFLDLFCCNMNAPVAERDLGTIKDIVSSCKQTVLVVDESAVIFSRLWCMYEAWLAAVLSQRSTNPQGGLKVALHFADPHSLEDAMQLLAAQRVQCHSREEKLLLLEDLQEDNQFGSTTIKVMLPQVQEAILATAKLETAAAVAHSKSTPRRLLQVLSKLAKLHTAVGNHWDAEKALRQALQASTQAPNLLSRAEETYLGLCLAEIMFKRGFIDEAERLALQAQQVYEDLLYSSTQQQTDPHAAPQQQHAGSARQSHSGTPAARQSLSGAPPARQSLSGVGGALAALSSLSSQQAPTPQAEVLMHDAPHEGLAKAVSVLLHVALARGHLAASGRLLDALLGNTYTPGVSSVPPPAAPAPSSRRKATAPQSGTDGGSVEAAAAAAAAEEVEEVEKASAGLGLRICRAPLQLGAPLVAPGSRRHVDTLCLQATLLSKSGQPAKAEACLREALKSARALLGPAHLVVGNICHRLAAMLHAGAHRELDRAERGLDEARRQAFNGALNSPRGAQRPSLAQAAAALAVGPGSPGTGSASSNRLRDASAAVAYAKETTARSLAEALELASRAIHVREQVLGKEHALFLEAQVLETNVLLSMGKHIKAEAQIERVLTSCGRLFGASHDVTQQAHDVVARLRDSYIMQGQAARRTLDDATAESLLRKALHVNSWIFCDDEDGRIRQELSELLRRQGRRLEGPAAPAVRISSSGAGPVVPPLQLPAKT